MKRIILIITTGLIALTSCNKKEQGRNFLFDMGPDQIPAEKGYTHVGALLKYDSAKGFGWLYAPVSVFDTANEKLHSQALRSGVWGKDSLVFRADVPDGDYNIILSLGNKDSIPMKMLVSVNGETLPDTIESPWYRLAYKTIRHHFAVTNGRAEIKINGVGTDVGLYAIEIRTATKSQEIQSVSSLEEDTAVIRNFRSTLLAALENDTADTRRLNQLDIVDKYLLACYYYDGGGWSWAAKETGFSLIYRMYAAADLLEQITADPADPLYERAVYLLARIYYWMDKEDSNPRFEEEAKRLFVLLQKDHPENKIIRMYLGEQLPDDDHAAVVKNDGAPQWAVHQQEAMHRMLELIHWWVAQKQTPNGEMGGKYGDDVELLRWWLPAVLGADDSLAKIGYTRLADGVWNSGVLERGFAKRVDDVEHSAELFRDTHPGMFLVKYGDPEYVERCLISMQNFRDVWTGITSLGHRHFKSYYLSAAAVVPQYPYGVDVALNARALLPGLWAAWYNNNPSIIQLFNEWCRSWIEDAARSSNGKPAGVLPSAVAFEGDKIGGDSKEWYDPKLTYDYYNWDHMGHVNELQYHMLGMYKITGNELFLRTVNFDNDLLLFAKKQGAVVNHLQPGSLEWVKARLLAGGTDRDPNQHPMGKLFAMAKQLTMQSRYDSLLKDYGQPYNKYVLGHDTNVVIAGLKNILETLRFNWPMLTSEVKFTDRVYVPGSNLLMGMYTGHFGAGYEFPALAVSWRNTGRDIAVFVQNGDNKSIRASLYNFGKAKEISMRTWQLEPGIYRVKVATDADNNGIAEEKLIDINVELKERVNDIAMSIPSGKSLIVEVSQVRPFNKAVTSGPDLAIHTGSIELKKNDDGIQLIVPVHNIGNAAAKDSRITLFIDGKETDSTVLPLLEAPNNLEPRSKQVIFMLKPFTGKHQVRVEVKNAQPEITSLNNKAEGIINNTGREVSVSF